MTTYNYATVRGRKMFYREAGKASPNRAGVGSMVESDQTVFPRGPDRDLEVHAGTDKQP
jgi:hypothetical protein